MKTVHGEELLLPFEQGDKEQSTGKRWDREPELAERDARYPNHLAKWPRGALSGVFLPLSFPHVEICLRVIDASEMLVRQHFRTEKIDHDAGNSSRESKFGVAVAEHAIRVFEDSPNCADYGITKLQTRIAELGTPVVETLIDRFGRFRRVAVQRSGIFQGWSGARGRRKPRESQFPTHSSVDGREVASRHFRLHFPLLFRLLLVKTRPHFRRRTASALSLELSSSREIF